MLFKMPEKTKNTDDADKHQEPDDRQRIHLVFQVEIDNGINVSLKKSRGIGFVR